MMQPQLAQPWGGASHFSDIAGPVHWVDFGGPAGVPPIVMVHGLGGSHLNWVRIAGPLAERNRVIAIDLPGFGFSPAAGRRTTIEANTKVLDRFINETLGGPVILMGNSMGGAITILESAASPQAVAAVILVDPALPRPAEVPDPQVAAQFLMYALPGVGEAFMDISRRSRTDRELVERVVNLCFADPRRSSPEVMDCGHRTRRTTPPPHALPGCRFPAGRTVGGAGRSQAASVQEHDEVACAAGAAHPRRSGSAGARRRRAHSGRR